MDELQKTINRKAFCPGHPSLKEIKRNTHRLNHEYNLLYEGQVEERNKILKTMIGELGEGVFLQEPITFHYGIHTRIGDHTFINFNFCCQDDAQVTIGKHCDIGPNLTIVTAVHPILPDEREAFQDFDGMKRRLIYAEPVAIGDHCWFGANVVICPGVTIGDNCVIGAGSVVTKDIKANCVAAGNPCRVLRELSESDSWKYRSDL